ncbi:hypothetical protein HYT23_04540 [Candidatus Pacearchaeota archaeon]|nr:hypothetical protein [Candidatus Pacearchaeota archaeon]
MIGTIDMQHMRYINLFEKISDVSTKYCFKYNETIFFCVPRSMISKSIGENGKNVKQLSRILGKKIKIIPEPRGEEDLKTFIENIVAPVQFKDFQLLENEITVSGNTQTKASLIGRNKRRLLEMQEIIKNFFSRDFRVV